MALARAMNPQLHAVALGIEILAWALGVPAACGLVLGGFAQFFRKAPTRAAGAGGYGAQNPDAILLVLGGMSRAISWLAQLLGALGGFLLRGVFWVSLAVLPLALVLFFTARGLHAGESWARWIGGLMAAGFALVAGISALAGRGWLRIAALLLALIAGYVAVVLVWSGF